mgnify:CR=1 FL=1
MNLWGLGFLRGELGGFGLNLRGGFGVNLWGLGVNLGAFWGEFLGFGVSFGFGVKLGNLG